MGTSEEGPAGGGARWLPSPLLACGAARSRVSNLGAPGAALVEFCGARLRPTAMVIVAFQSRQRSSSPFSRGNGRRGVLR
eukprot:1972532-Pyramimonas_sp.AAC.1